MHECVCTVCVCMCVCVCVCMCVCVCVYYTTVVCAGLVGLAISYALSVTGLLSGVVTSFTETEKQMVSVERAMQYITGAPTETDTGTTQVHVHCICARMYMYVVWLIHI